MTRTATIRFVGTTDFAAGEWVGLEYDEAVGKNDGSVKGERYFECEQDHGMFIRPEKIVRVLEEPTPKPAAKARQQQAGVSSNAKPAAAKTRTSTVGAARTSVVGNASLKKGTTGVDPTGARRRTMNAASPTPAGRSSALATSSTLR